LASNNKFSDDENELILNHIPWTAMVEDKDIHYGDGKQPLIPLLRNNKEQFVIKAANGYQGKDVFIGKFSSDEEWEEAINLGLGTTSFIAQEFSDSVTVMAPNKENEWAPHKLIWGAFSFGEIYGGVWVRMSAVKTDVGVINSATGAVEALVYETMN
jgi:hypothetical protein